MIDRFIVVGPYDIDGVNGVHNDLVVGLLSPTALAGLGHKVERDVSRGLPAIALRTLGTSAIVHSWSKMEGHPKFPPASRDATKGAPILDEVKLRARMSFIFEVRCDIDAESEDAEEAVDSIVSFISSNMLNCGFGGGRLFLARATGAAIKNSVSIVRKDELVDLVRRMPGGHMLFDRRDLLSSSGRTQGDTLDQILRLLTRQKDQNSGRYFAPVKGFVVPINVGFQALEKPAERANPRVPSARQKHVYAESITSLGEFKSVRSLIRNTDGSPFDGSFWTHHSNSDAGTYYVSASGKI